MLHHPVHLFRDGMDARSYLEPLLPLVHAVEVAQRHDGRRRTTTWRRPSSRAWNGRGTHARLGQTGGSDAHVLRHVGTAFTEAPGRTREEFLESLKRGESRAAGVHGTTCRLAVEIYGVMVNYWGALLGFGSSGLTPGGARPGHRRIGCC